MKPVYIDIHIHTSDNPNQPNNDYNIKALKKGIEKITKNEYPVLICLSDHNMINKAAYMSLKEYFDNIILGAEIHIRKYEGAQPYHCHILFNADVTETVIDSINSILDKLYKNKVVEDTDLSIPNIETISNEFDEFEFMLLPHGGQSHRTFDKATAKGHIFDKSMERSLYYNHFEGFTARSNSGVNETKEYFKKLGIDQFTNLITCSDNYNPVKYPEPKGKNSEQFVPTWMLSEPTFEGLRLALSESTRLFYGMEPPENWNGAISKVYLSEDLCDIDVDLSPGLNVVIGGSSSGKTLFVDSLYKKTKNDFSGSDYIDFGVENISVNNPSGVCPHYLNQNFIMSVLQNREMTVGDIPIIKEVFPEDDTVVEQIRKSLSDAKHLIEQLVDSAERYNRSISQLSHIALPSFLIMPYNGKSQIASLLKSKNEKDNKYHIDITDYNRYLDTLREIRGIFEYSDFSDTYLNEIDDVIKGINYIKNLSDLDEKVTEILDEFLKKEINIISNENREYSQKVSQRNTMFECIKESLDSLKSFYGTRDKLATFNVSFKTKEIECIGHKLSITNEFKLTEEVMTKAINKFLKNNYRVKSFSEIEPSNICNDCFSEKPKVRDYSDYSEKVYAEIAGGDKKNYKITTSSGSDFDILSPGWKSAVILELVMGYNRDTAPLIIDQPEDNLATDFINHGLVDQIKSIKPNKQIILVSHNATIPMIGDAQTIIVCNNVKGKIVIRSAPLESEIDGKRIIDYIAEITDGGKPSIKKRVKKYDLKRFRED